MSRQVNRGDLALFVLLMVVAEIFVDAIAGDYIKQWVTDNVGTIPVLLGVLAVMVAVWVRFVKYETMLGGEKRMAKFSSRNAFRWFFRNGKLDMVEFLAFMVFLIFAGYAFGLWIADVANTYTWIKDFGMWFLVGSGLIVFFKGKERTRGKPFTLTEIAAVAVAIILPLSMLYQPLGDWLQVSTYISDVGSKLIAFIISVGALLYAAKQD
jgi:hypothetical protein